MKFFNVYILENIAGWNFYIGITEDLRIRLKKHNAGEVPHTGNIAHGELKLPSLLQTKRAQ